MERSVSFGNRYRLSDANTGFEPEYGLLTPAVLDCWFRSRLSITTIPVWDCDTCPIELTSINTRDILSV